MKKTILILGILIIGACNLPTTNSISYLRYEPMDYDARIDSLFGSFGRLSLLEDRIAKLESESQERMIITDPEQKKLLERLRFALSTIEEQLGMFELRLSSVENKI